LREQGVGIKGDGPEQLLEFLAGERAVCLRLFGLSRGCRAGWRCGGRRIVLSLGKQRVGGQSRRHRQSEQTMRAPCASADCTHHWRALPFPISRTVGETLAPSPKVKSKIFHARLYPISKMSCCASGKYDIDRGQQVRCDGSFQDKSIGSRFNRRQLCILFLVDAENDQLQLREMATDSANQPEPVAALKREVDHRQSDVELTRAFEQ